MPGQLWTPISALLRRQKDRAWLEPVRRKPTPGAGSPRTTPRSVVAKRRAANKTARQARKRNRRP